MKKETELERKFREAAHDSASIDQKNLDLGNEFRYLARRTKLG